MTVPAWLIQQLAAVLVKAYEVCAGLVTVKIDSTMFAIKHWFVMLSASK